MKEKVLMVEDQSIEAPDLQQMLNKVCDDMCGVEVCKGIKELPTKKAL
jgi:hypothetical protein